MANYTWLFPYEKITYGASIVIYGAGRMGQEYMKQLAINHYCRIVAVVDRNYHKYGTLIHKVSAPDDIDKFDFDYVVIALELPKYYNDIKSFLLDKGIPNNKIVAVFSRQEEPIDAGAEIETDDVGSLACDDKEHISIAIKTSGTLGGNIIRKKVVEALEAMNDNIKIDIYSPAADTFLSYLYQTSKCVNKLIPDGGGMFVKKSSAYDLSLNVSSFIKVEHISLNKWMGKFPEFVTRMMLLQKVSIKNKIDFTQPMYTYYARAIKKGQNCYTCYDYDGALDINDTKVDIKLDLDYREKYKALQLSDKYITINYGNGVTMQDESIVAKQWPKKYFEEFIHIFHDEYPNVKIIQIGSANALRLDGVDNTIFGQRIELIGWVLKKSLLHVDIEGGLVHLATQLGTKCAVIFGQTQLEFFGYENNINIHRGKCQGCNGMYLDVNVCAKGMKNPECMYSVTPKFVIQKIETYIQKKIREI